jgi:hypothetical protein
VAGDEDPEERVLEAAGLVGAAWVRVTRKYCPIMSPSSDPAVMSLGTWPAMYTRE